MQQSDFGYEHFYFHFAFRELLPNKYANCRCCEGDVDLIG